jgi:hypothetical protein
VRLGFLAQTITVRSQTGAAADGGDPVFGPPRCVAARVQPGRDRNEDEISHTHVVYAASEIKADDRVWFPGDTTSDDTKARKPVHVEAMVHPTQGTIGWKALF